MRRPSGRWAQRAAAATIVVGSAVRIEQFGWRRSLWLDEALVTANVVHRGFLGLLRPLSGQQGAPVGWLWVERAAVLALGNNEYALRLIPLLSGVAALVFVHAVARRLLGPWPAVVAVAALAASPAAVRYSVEVKQYSSDLAVALLLTLLALRAGSSRAGGSLWAWGGVGAVAVWCSHPAVLVVAGTGAALAVGAVAAGDTDRLRLVGKAGVLWALSFAVDWWVALRPLGHNTYLHRYWAAGFAPRPVGLGSFVGWMTRIPARLAHDPASLPLPWVAAALIGFGLAAIVVARPLPGALLVAPLLVGAGAAAAVPTPSSPAWRSGRCPPSSSASPAPWPRSDTGHGWPRPSPSRSWPDRPCR